MSVATEGSFQAPRRNKRKGTNPHKAPESHRDRPTFIPADFSSYIQTVSKAPKSPDLVNDRALGGALPPRSSYQPASPVKPTFKPIRHRCNMTAEELAEMDAEAAAMHPKDALGSDDISPSSSARVKGPGRRKAVGKTVSPKGNAEQPGPNTSTKKRRARVAAGPPSVAVDAPSHSGPAQRTTRGSSRNGEALTRSASAEPTSEATNEIATSNATSGVPPKRRRLAVNSAMARSGSVGPASPLRQEFTYTSSDNTPHLAPPPAKEVHVQPLRAYSPTVSNQDDGRHEDQNSMKRTMRVRDETTHLK